MRFTDLITPGEMREKRYCWKILSINGQFAADLKTKPQRIRLRHGEELQFSLDLSGSTIRAIELIDLRFHNVHSSDTKDRVAVGAIECYINEKRFVPTTPFVGESTLPAFQVALPSSRLSDWGTFAVVVVDAPEITSAMIGSRTNFAFKWIAYPDYVEATVPHFPTFEAKSFEYALIAE